ncbi:TLD protein (macronuclear) [Tetrahymena thermophila SB210]|uniref:Oxidation resistance protein 1 n=1 Tax=Tetrahymena thermophila (strain SB210) TaxID=312017 RepID=Q23DK1_TETTS|nr:TLD protein [Tetrahymena thermophila SB210]EAR94416.3 TLD protein [Tetrahymena thermophila SB210]|eukprot:XP_001014685.3 TLD protein [Tetrahymena thermophila SB210]
MRRSLSSILENGKDIIFSFKKMLDSLYDFEILDLKENIQLKDEYTYFYDFQSTCTFKNIAYVTPYGNVKGNLIVSKDIISFNPVDMQEVQQIIQNSQKQNNQIKTDETPKKKINIKASDFFVNIEVFDIYSVKTYVVEFDSLMNYYDIYIDIYLETANGLNKPLQDQQGNQFLLKVVFKSANHYSLVDVEELQKKIREEALILQQRAQENQKDSLDVDTQDTAYENNTLEVNPIPQFSHHEQAAFTQLNHQNDNAPHRDQVIRKNKITISKTANEIQLGYDENKMNIEIQSASILINGINHEKKEKNLSQQEQDKQADKKEIEQSNCQQEKNMNNFYNSHHLSLINFSTEDKPKKVRLYSIVGFTFIHLLEIKLRYIINQMGFEDNQSKESGTFAFFWEKIFYQYVHQVNYSWTYQLDQKYIPQRDQDSFIFNKNDKLFNQIIQNLPSTFQYSDWGLSYTPNRHGYSYNEFLFRCSASLGPHVIIIKDSQDNIFGAFASHGWRKSRYFYGDGESFLFKFEHIEQLHQEQKIKVFRYTGENNNIQYCGNEGIAMGIGENYGLFINRDFYKGLSFPTNTFGNKLGLHIQNNECLDSNKKVAIHGEFQIKDIEFWSLDPYLQENLNKIKKPSLLRPQEQK